MADTNEAIPKWILRNLRDFGNCAVNCKTLVEKGLENKILALYKNATFRYVNTNDEVITYDYCLRRMNILMCYISI